MGRQFLLRLAMVAAVAALTWVVTGVTTDVLPSKAPTATTPQIEAVRLDPVTGEVMQRAPEPPPKLAPAPGFACRLTGGRDEDIEWALDRMLWDQLPRHLHRFYAEALETHPDLEGTLTLRWVIGDDVVRSVFDEGSEHEQRQATAIRVMDTTLGKGGDEFAATIQELIGLFRYPVADAPVTVMVRFVFSPRVAIEPEQR